MPDNPKVSVLMPAYNAEKYIGEAIESILNQTFKDFEFIIIDDCSTDKTRGIIEEYARKDERIRIFYNKENLNIYRSTNLAIEESQANLLAKMDADDVAMPDRLKKQYEVLINNPEVAVVGAWMEIIDENGRKMGIRKYLQNDAELRKKIFRYSPIAQPVAMFKKSAINELGGYLPLAKLPLAEDVNLWFKIGTKYKFANVQEVLLKYRFFKNSSSNRKLRKVEIKTLKMRWYAWRCQGYKANFFDFIYNIGQALTIYLMPVKWRIKLFNFVRNHL